MDLMSKVRKFVCILFYSVAIVGFLFSVSFLVVNVSELPYQLTHVSKKNNAESQQNKASKDSKEAEESGRGNAANALDVKTKSGSKSDKQTIKTEAAKLSLFRKGHEFFRAISLDLSAISPFLLVWFFCAVLYSGFNYHHAWPKLGNRDHNLQKRIISFPFPARYQVTCIQLGFIGTLWGFLMIGWRLNKSLGSDANQSVETLDILLKAFGTALISTFTAVVLAYVAAPLVRSVWRWINEIDMEYQVDSGLTTKVYELNDKLKKTASSVKTLNEEVQNLSKELVDLELTPEKIATSMEAKITLPIVDAIERLKLGIADISESSTNKLVSAIEEMKTATEEVTKIATEVRNATLDMNKNIGEIKAVTHRIERKNSDHAASVVTFSKKVTNALGKITTVTTAMEEFTRQLPGAFEKAQSENSAHIIGEIGTQLDGLFTKMKREFSSMRKQIISSRPTVTTDAVSGKPSIAGRIMNRIFKGSVK